MDHIYPTKDYKVYKVKDEIKKLKASVLASKMPSDFNEISSVLGISLEKLKEISLEVCSSYEDFGTDIPSNAPAPFSSFPEEALKLNVVQTIREATFAFKEPRVKELAIMPKIELETADLKPFEDCVITVRFYEPFRYAPSLKNQPRFHQEYHVLGSNLLTELRDNFYCHCNQGPFFDISDDPSNAASIEPETNPGFFFIHETFYNDNRNASNCDYSEVIRNWYKKIDYIKEFKTESMENIKFEDLSIRIGYPCVYQHHGACEHIFCITSVDLIDQSHNLNRSAYPFLIASGRKRSTLCDICGQSDAAFLVTNCAIHVKDPMRLCYDCFFGLHYESDGITKVCSFNAYRLFGIRPEKMK